MILEADETGAPYLSQTYYSIGGGFVQTELEQQASRNPKAGVPAVPYPFSSAASMLQMGDVSGLTIAQMKRANETVAMTEGELDQRLNTIWAAMNACMSRGLQRHGQLPGGLKVKRRAADIFAKLQQEHGSNSVQPHQVMDYLSVYAMAVNEENAAGGRIVTAPTNGAAGVVPAVMVTGTAFGEPALEP